MFDKLKNFFSPQKETPVDLQFFLKDETAAPLTDKQQFLVSLAQIIGEHHNHYTNTLSAGKNRDFYAEKMSTWYGITDAETAHDFIQSRLEEGFKHYYNQIIEEFKLTKGDVSLLPISDDEKEEFTFYFEHINEVLALREGQFWFTNGFGIADGFDHGRIAYVVKSSYTLGYLTEVEAWEYLEEIGEMAIDKFSSWNEYAKSYLLGKIFKIIKSQKIKVF
ncbi:DUF1266 domain-containing protein [bacterium]|nr:MAG: DUF1266 domain-containing protein [bacterium]